jgi:integrase
MGIVPTIVFPEKAGTARERWLTRDEADRLLASCGRRHVRLAVLIALNTTARIGSIVGLTWDRVDLDARRIDFRTPREIQTKKKRSIVPINDTLYAALVEARARATCPYVIEFAGRQVANVKHGFAAAVARASLSDDVTPHVTRHTGVTWMLQAGISPWDVSQFAGVSLEVIQETYGHHCPSFLLDASKALETKAV